MREGAFYPLAPLTHQALAARATNPPPIGIHRGLGLRLLRPIAATTVRLREASIWLQMLQEVPDASEQR
jgi:hypothetical protein